MLFMALVGTGDLCKDITLLKDPVKHFPGYQRLAW